MQIKIGRPKQESKSKYQPVINALKKIKDNPEKWVGVTLRGGGDYERQKKLFYQAIHKNVSGGLSMTLEEETNRAILWMQIKPSSNGHK